MMSLMRGKVEKSDGQVAVWCKYSSSETDNRIAS